ncbi:MAG: phosphoglycerate kinase [Actinomycetota bacterium]
MTAVVRIPSLDDLAVAGKKVLLRVDINSPIDPKTGRIADFNRIDKSLPTIRDLADRGARLVLIAHQGDTLDYHNLIDLAQHAAALSGRLGRPVGFVDDVAGPAARRAIKALGDGDVLLLDNLRYLTEEVSTFERDVKLTPQQMAGTYLVRNLAPLFDYYVNDAFAAAHRASPSMVAFQEVLPTAAGRLLMAEIDALTAVSDAPLRPCLYLLGGLKISDAFDMLGKVLTDGTADEVLTAGITGQVFLLAQGVALGEPSERFIRDRNLEGFVAQAKQHLASHAGAIRVPLDVAVEADGKRVEVAVEDLPTEHLIVDIGSRTSAAYAEAIGEAATVFVNGPPGAYENPNADAGTRALWQALADTPAHTVVGGGDTVSSAKRFIDTGRIDVVSTGGGALIRYLSGKPLPLIEAMRAAAERFWEHRAG